MCCCDIANLWSFKRVRTYTHLKLTSDFALTWESDHTSNLFDCYYHDGHLYITGQFATLGTAQKIRADDATIVWGKSPNTSNEATSIAVDSDGNVITAYYQTTTGVHAINTYGPSGSTLWDLEFGTAGGVYDLCVDSSDNVIAFGKGILSGVNTMYLQSYDQSGTDVWPGLIVFARSNGGVGAGGVATDSSTITAVATVGQDGIGPSGPLANVRQYDMNGSILWRYNTSNNLKAAAYGASGVVYVGGVSTFGIPTYTSYITAFDVSGAVVWATDLGRIDINAIAVDSLGNIYAAGSRALSINVTKLDSSGNILATFDYQLGQGAAGFGVPSTGIAIDANDNVYVCGSRVITA